MRILVIGGTWFLGQAVVNGAVMRGHEVTVFNRGRTRAEVPATVQAVIGDRRDPASRRRLAELRPWDAVLDLPGVVPAEVRDMAQTLAPATGLYVFVSTVSAYRDWPAQPVDETSPLHEGDPDANPGGWEWGTGVYGPLKAGAEAAVRREVGEDRALIVRPGVILGPWEYGGRLTWWLDRAARGGQILSPGRAADHIRPVDVRDLAGFLLDLVEQRQAGVFNVAGPAGRDTFGGLLDACLTATGSAGRPVWVPADWLRAHEVREWTELPMWRTAAGTWAVDTTRAEAAGLVCRPLVETVTDTWSWMVSGERPVDDPRRSSHGIDPDREAELLAAWGAANS